MTTVGTITEAWRYPVKSMQGFTVEELAFTPFGTLDDRRFALVDMAKHELLSAKRKGELLQAAASDEAITLPDGRVVGFDAPDRDAVLSEWLGVDVQLRFPDPDVPLNYSMTFDPPNDDAEYYEIPSLAGTFFDLAHVHLVHAATLRGCAAARPDLDWQVRRFRPSLVIDGPLDDTFGEQAWVGSSLRIGESDDALTLAVSMATVRCAMPLRAQPGGIEREPGIFKALNELNTEVPNHFGLYLQVEHPGVARVGDPVTLVPAA